jgi:hypothetical protein
MPLLIQTSEAIVVWMEVEGVVSCLVISYGSEDCCHCCCSNCPSLHLENGDVGNLPGEDRSSRRRHVHLYLRYHVPDDHPSSYHSVGSGEHVCHCLTHTE